ncbi:MAG: ExbD/TolR family protein [Myxococcota bacterium]|nr:biopolymer transporter ExbD [Myxococcota bacterium]
MGMTVQQGGKGVKPEMNVTPLVDVVLVLLIIFMVVTPLLTKTFEVAVPKKDDSPPPAVAIPPLVVRLDRDGSVRINDTVVPQPEVAFRLQQELSVRNDGQMLFDADDGANYGAAVTLMDTARGAGARTIAVIPEATIQ